MFKTHDNISLVYWVKPTSGEDYQNERWDSLGYVLVLGSLFGSLESSTIGGFTTHYNFVLADTLHHRIERLHTESLFRRCSEDVQSLQARLYNRSTTPNKVIAPKALYNVHSQMQRGKCGIFTIYSTTIIQLVPGFKGTLSSKF
jgi:hypothetical protein